MNIIRSNLVTLLRYAIDKREEEERKENPTGHTRSGHLESWKRYLEEVQAGDGIIVVVDR